MRKTSGLSLSVLGALAGLTGVTSTLGDAVGRITVSQPTFRGYRGTHGGKSRGNYGTNWKVILNGQTNGKRECERRVRQMARNAANRARREGCGLDERFALPV